MRCLSTNPIDRIPWDVAARLPPPWDSPDMKQRIYGTFECLQLAIAGGGNPNQVQALMKALRQLTDAAETRRGLLTLDHSRIVALPCGV